MNYEQFINQLRGLHFIMAVLEKQQNDPFCGKCTAFARSAAKMTDKFIEFKTSHASEIKDLPGEFSAIFSKLCERASNIHQPEEHAGQKKAGNCNLPQGVCFAKASVAVFEKLAG